MHPSKWHLLATNKKTRALIWNKEHVRMGEKGVRFNLNHLLMRIPSIVQGK